MREPPRPLETRTVQERPVGGAEILNPNAVLARLEACMARGNVLVVGQRDVVLPAAPDHHLCRVKLEVGSLFELRTLDDDEPIEQLEPGATMVYKPKTPVPTQAVSPAELGMEQEIAVLTFDGTRHEVKQRRVVLGRSRDCDIQLADANVSRRHAELRQEGASYWIVDLGSTNGMEVNGKRVKRAKLAGGDTITLGSTKITFDRERK